MIAHALLALCCSVAASACRGGNEPARDGRAEPISGEQRAPAPLCQITPGHECLAQGLPRAGDGWSEAEAAAFIDRAKQGVVALVTEQGTSRVVSDCRLDGRYIEILGSPKTVRFWASQHVLYHPADVTPPCTEATHMAAAFVLRDGTELSAILVPLPCPSVTDPAPAPGCVGRGKTGPERKLESERRFEALPLRTPSPEVARSLSGQLLELYALAPDGKERLLRTLGAMPSHSDCFYPSEATLLMHHLFAAWSDPLPWKDRPTIGFHGDCETRPAFLSCFPEFTPAPAKNCWQPVDASQVGF